MRKITGGDRQIILPPDGGKLHNNFLKATNYSIAAYVDRCTHSCTRLPGRQGLFANIRPELSPGQATRRLQLFNRLSALSEKVILPGHFSSTPHHRSFLLSDCSTFICTKSQITIQQLYSPWFNFFFLMQCPRKADTKAVSGLAITIRREAGVKILCDRTQSPERKRETILVGPLQLFP